jgi:hypothetical protein
MIQKMAKDEKIESSLKCSFCTKKYKIFGAERGNSDFFMTDSFFQGRNTQTGKSSCFQHQYSLR